MEFPVFHSYEIVVRMVIKVVLVLVSDGEVWHLRGGSVPVDDVGVTNECRLHEEG